nr:MAG TPA: hypothetical protein [Caudoviricetes sp.]
MICINSKLSIVFCKYFIYLSISKLSFVSTIISII